MHGIKRLHTAPQFTIQIALLYAFQRYPKDPKVSLVAYNPPIRSIIGNLGAACRNSRTQVIRLLRGVVELAFLDKIA